MDVFNIHIEFNPQVLKDTIEKHIREKQKAYVCVVDGNVLTIAQKDMKYRNIIKGATINACDGSSIAKLVNKIYGTDYHAYNGPEIFEYYIERPYKHLLVGNTKTKVEQIKAFVKEKGIDVDLQHLDVPFVPVDQFNYEGLAKKINEIEPDIVWVSLGAPKQETFISNILPYVKQGIFFGIGAAFNFYTGDLHNNKKEIGGLRLIWLERILKDPPKQLKRAWNYLTVLPSLYYGEKKKYKLSKRE